MDFRFGKTRLHFLHRKLQKPSKLSALYPVRFLRTSAQLCRWCLSTPWYRPTFSRDGQLERKVGDIQPRWDNTHTEKSPPIPVTPLCLITLPSTYRRSRLSHLLLSFASRVSWHASNSTASGGQWRGWVWLPPARSLATPPSMSSEFRLAALDSFVSSARQHFNVQLREICRLRFLLCPSLLWTDSVWYHHYANWSRATSFDVVAELTAKLWNLCDSWSDVW